ncbi:hypothetical protein U879_00180 [Defluviimonas sp. 20V17]|uniref:Uncharacterized protein n=1 Tax=Allgaiera indica TaxID=765699 RepID=A0AAN4UP46_9RHOB|nr:hypothetical protein U879_00180 [Defluviimonas sp. 20V17]GHD98960.1 hypothetical protein GCM10008024_04570 [Allgaiera indica]SDW02719.1 hypothetical protein SAMN05444006_10190 [Allgaiera indica]
MPAPQAFRDFTLQLHQDLYLVYPGWLSEASGARHELYQGFRLRFGDQAVKELAAYLRYLLNDAEADLAAHWMENSKADWLFDEAGLRWLYADFARWASIS